VEYEHVSGNNVSPEKEKTFLLKLVELGDQISIYCIANRQMKRKLALFLISFIYLFTNSQ